MTDTIDLLNGMIVRDPDERLPLEDVLQHPWFNDLKSIDSEIKIYKDDTNQGISENSKLLKKLSSVGFVSDKILKSVKSEACDSLSALWHFTSMKTNGSSLKLTNSQEQLTLSTSKPDPFSNSEIYNMDISSPPQFGDEYRQLLAGEPISPIKGPRKTSWGESLPSGSLQSIRRNMRGDPIILDRTRSMSATTSTIRSKKKNVIEEQDEELMF